MIKILKLLALIPMAMFELLFLMVCWIVAFCHKPTGFKLTQWSLDNLPAKEWYLSKDTEDEFNDREIRFHREIKEGANAGCFVVEPFTGGSHSTVLDNMIDAERERLESEGKCVIYLDTKAAL